MRSRPGRAAGRLGGFVLLPLLGALAPLLVLPAVTAAFGQTVWVSVAIAQSCGSAAAVVVELGWGLSGSQRVARQSVRHRPYLLALVTLTKLLAFAGIAPVVVAVVVLVAPGEKLPAVLIALSGALGSIDTVWLFVGTGEPLKILLIESLPRLAITFAAADAIALGGSLWWFVAACGVPAVVCPAIGIVFVGVRGRHFRAYSPARIGRATVGQASALAGRALSAAYIALPVVLVSAVTSNGGAATFAAAERMQRMGLTGLQAFPNALQGWVGAGRDRAERFARARTAILVNGVVGVAAGIGLTMLGPWMSRILFSGVATISHLEAAVSATMITIVCLSRAVGGIALVAAGRIDGVGWSALVGACLGVPAILVLGHAWGAPGGLAGEVVAEAAVLAVQLRFLRTTTLGMRGAAGGSVSAGGAGAAGRGTVSPRVLYFRIGDLDYPRNARIRRFLANAGYDVDAHVRARGGRWRRTLADLHALVERSRRADAIVVAEISLDFVAAAWAVSRWRRIPLVVDGFIGKHETLVGDHDVYRRVSPGALRCRVVDFASVTLADLFLVDTRARRDLAATQHPRARIVSLPVGAPPEFDGRGPVGAPPEFDGHEPVGAPPGFGGHERGRAEDARRESIAAPRLGSVAGSPRASRGLRVLFYGSYLPLHGVDTIVRALALARAPGSALEECVDIDLTMIGTAAHRGGTADTRALAAELGVLESITFLPTMPLAEVALAASRHDVVLGLFGGSDKAGTVIANKVWQGLASGRTVVTREGGGVDEIRALVGAQLVTIPARDAPALAAVLRRLAARRPARYPGMAATLEAYVSARFDEFGGVFDALLGRSTSRGGSTRRIGVFEADPGPDLPDLPNGQQPPGGYEPTGPGGHGPTGSGVHEPTGSGVHVLPR